jgi:D-alanyl-D-alanine carboxypeptidase (penicillin-binding protein 5/6)
MYTDENKDALPSQKVTGGIEDTVNLTYEGAFEYLDTQGSNLNEIQKEISLPDTVEAPVAEGDAIGEAVYRLNGTRIGSVSILAAHGVEKAGYQDYYKKVWLQFLMNRQ